MIIKLLSVEVIWKSEYCFFSAHWTSLYLVCHAYTKNLNSNTNLNSFGNSNINAGVNPNTCGYRHLNPSIHTDGYSDFWPEGLVNRKIAFA